MEFQTQIVKTDDGGSVEVRWPKESPDDIHPERAQVLWDDNVKELDSHWKGRVVATVGVVFVDEMEKAMEFFGALVDSKTVIAPGLVTLYSAGYRAHGF